MSAQRILIVEDNPANLKLAAYLLRGAGYEVEAATMAAEGIALARAMSPDLVLMDVDLPEMDGLSATRQLKIDPATAAIPVVALTANAMHGDRERCLDAGCTGYIAKPISAREFVQSVAAYLGKGG